MTTKININGDIQDEAFISILDHGFLFGDSIYEVVCTNNGKPCFLNEHLKRLYASASAISLSFPSPAGDFFMFKKTNTAVKSPNKPKPIGKKALEIIKVSSLLSIYLLLASK